jgi:parvulin-like peptidyl-prolyl isomerase
MINERLVLQAADRDRVTVSDNEVNAQIEKFKAVLERNLGRKPTDAEFAQAVRNESGMEVPAFREYLKKQLITRKYLMTKKENLLKSIKPPTEAEISNFYNLHKAEIVRPETVRFSMIQIPYGPDAASKAKAKTLADRLVREIGSDPAKFDEAAVKGRSPSAGYQAGDAGYLPRNAEAQQLVGQEFMNAAFSLKQGQVSKLLEGPRAYQIIKVTETYVQKSLELDDVFQLETRITVRKYISDNLAQQMQQRIFNQATQELIAELRKGNPFTIIEKNLTL